MLKKTVFFLGIFSLLAAQTYALGLPVVDEIPEAVDSPTYTIKGTIEPGALITVTGGISEIPPVTANSLGRFSIIVGLAQNQENRFSIVASLNGEWSKSVEIVIKEGAKEAKAYAEETGKDVIAPHTPEIDSVPSPVDADNIYISGKAEPFSLITVTKPDLTRVESIRVNKNGAFRIEVPLQQNFTNWFNIYSSDYAGNASVSVQVKIVEESIEENIKPRQDEEVGEIKEIVEIKENENIEEDKKDKKAEEEKGQAGFADITGHWAKEYIEKLRREGIINGRTETSYAPDELLTRAEITKIALNAFNISADEIGDLPFSDVGEDIWYAPYIFTAYKLEIINGYQNAVFSPNRPVTRAEALKILIEASGVELAEAGENNFLDVDKNAWYAPYILFSAEKNIVSGYSDKTFRPDSNITRAEAAKMVVKLMEFVE